MKALVDTCVWSTALRKTNFKANNPAIIELKEIIREGRVQLMGPIRQEISSGVKTQTQFTKLKKYLSFLPDLILQTQDYEKAASFYHQNHSKGIQGFNTDFLICALASRYNMPIFTVDKEFNLFQKQISIKLHIPRI